jgi:hypothetical protein
MALLLHPAPAPKVKQRIGNFFCRVHCYTPDFENGKARTNASSICRTSTVHAQHNATVLVDHHTRVERRR